MSDLRQQLDRLFSDMSEEMAYPFALNSDWKPFRLVQEMREKAWLPAIEVAETESSYLVKAEVPGMNPDDISVEVLGNMVTLKGETRQVKKEDKQNIHRSEFRYGQFYRQIPLPENINSDACRAEFHHGILELTLPKLEKSPHKQIKIEVKSSQ
jgi:HSP20 family protein